MYGKKSHGTDGTNGDIRVVGMSFTVSMGGEEGGREWKENENQGPMLDTRTRAHRDRYEENAL